MSFQVAIVARDEESFVGRCIESLIKGGTSNQQIILVAHLCRDRTVEKARKYGVTVVNCDKTYGDAFNMALAIADSEYLIFMDADSVVPEGWSTRIETVVVKLFEGDPRLAGVGCFLLPYRNTSLLKRVEWLVYNHTQIRKMRRGKIDSLAGGTVWKRSALLRIGGFKAVSGGPEPELCRRLLESGYRLRITKEVKVYHEFLHKLYIFGGFRVPQNARDRYFLRKVLASPLSGVMLSINSWMMTHDAASFTLAFYYPARSYFILFLSILSCVRSRFG